MRVVAILVFCGALGGCATSDEFSGYVQRKDTVTLAAGNAKEINAATHLINPWPENVMDRRIPGDGQRAAAAVERYRDTGKISRTPCPLTPQFDIQAQGIRSQTNTQCGTAAAIQGIGANVGQPGTTTTVVTPGVAASQSTQ